VTLTADYLPAVSKIERASFTDPWPESAFLNLMIQSRTNWVALAEDEVAGYLVTQWVLDEIHILNLAVATSFRKRGIARQFLEFLVSRAKKRNVRDLYLEVRISNEAAKALYDAFGFSQLSTRRSYYPDGEDALVLHKRLS
jgi:ribosomal-protein-alanine N-acetyltransferase